MQGDLVKIESYVTDVLFEINISNFPCPLWINIVETIDKNFYMHEIKSGPDFDEIITNFNTTLSKCKILKVITIQNKFLWKQY